MKTKRILLAAFAALTLHTASAQNPYLPLWEYIPDGEPYVFEDPDNPGKYRVYVYGSHDSLIKEYCGREQVVWSAPVDNLKDWRYDGIIFESVRDANGKILDPTGRGDVLYAPDVAVRTEADGTKTYYLYPNNQAGGRNGMIATSKRPDGPFTVSNWDASNPRKSDGILGFDPAVFIDDDGRVYGYWGFEQSFGAELDPETMATVKEGTKPVKDLISNYKQRGKFRFFEASSMRKIEDKYVLIYSRWTEEGEFGLPSTNYTLAYAYSDNPLGPFKYGGTIIDGRGRDKDAEGYTIHTAHSTGNTHGSICEIDGQWWVFYHRQCGLSEYSRQAMVAPIDVSVKRGLGGKVTISEAEYTSEGFAIDGLNPLEWTPAGIACYYTGPKHDSREWPNYNFSGSYVKPTYIEGWPRSIENASADQHHNPVVNNTGGSVVGYKYFNFDLNRKHKDLNIVMKAATKGIRGEITVMLDSPFPKQGKELGKIYLSKGKPSDDQTLTGRLKNVKKITGKHALYFVFEAKKGFLEKEVPEGSLCDIYEFRFE